PTPAGDAAETGRAVWQSARALGEGGVLLCLVSGGGSAMLELPAPGVSIEDIQRRTDELLRAGADIHTLIAERRRLSQLKGGQLARAAAPARVINVILSDVPGGDVSVVASGPSVPPEPHAPGFEHVRTEVPADNGTAQDAIVRAGQQQGLRLERRSGFLSGEARDAGAAFYVDARARCERQGLDGVVWGGETTVHVTGGGRGGRNQELVLGAAQVFEGGVLGSLGTDGIDGASNAAGAIMDAAVLERAAAQGLAPQAFLDANDSESYFRRAGGLVETGPTGTNVADVCLYLHGPAAPRPALTSR
ncbi:MAG: glycerate kinase type-2 family protein, partial [Myxococcota bacterium]